MRKTTIMLTVGMTALLVLAFYWGVASAQLNSGAVAIGAATTGPFSLVKGGFHFGLGFGGYPYGGWGRSYGAYSGYGYGSGHYDYPNYGTRTEPYQTCVWSGYNWKCYQFNNSNDFY